MKTAPIALVTGATSGIGEATAYRLRNRGYVVFAAGRNPDALDTLRSQGLRARALDVTDEAAVARLVEEIHADYGGVDVLVNSAGFPLPCPLEQLASSDLRCLFETNVVATLHLSQLILAGMRDRGAGRIITIGSTGGRFTSPGAGGYHIARGGSFLDAPMWLRAAARGDAPEGAMFFPRPATIGFRCAADAPPEHP